MEPPPPQLSNCSLDQLVMPDSAPPLRRRFMPPTSPVPAGVSSAPDWRKPTDATPLTVMLVDVTLDALTVPEAVKSLAIAPSVLPTRSPDSST